MFRNRPCVSNQDTIFGLDQIVFQNRKADDIAAAKQFVMDNAAVNNITKEQTEMSTDDIISSQKK
jgi:hypothetical protein